MANYKALSKKNPYHGEEKANFAEERFKSVFQKGQIPSDILTVEASKENFDLAQIVVDNKLAPSKSELRRLVKQGGVKINSEKVNDLQEVVLEDELIVQIGKKKFIKINLVWTAPCQVDSGNNKN